MARLKEYGRIITGNTPPSSIPEYYVSNDICFVKPSDFSSNDVTIIEDSEYYISEAARQCARMIPEGSILVTCIGTVGKVGIAKKEMAFNQQINAIIPGNDVDASCLAYSLLYHADRIKAIANAPVVPIINKNVFSDIDIPLPDLPTQRRIAATLDKVSEGIDLCRKMLGDLDELIKSKFVELFGDCKEQTSIKESGLTISDGNYSNKYPRSEEFVESGIPFIRANNLKDGTVSDEDMYFITPTKHATLLKGHLRPNDVLITTRGNIGQVAIVPDKHNDSNINAQIVLLRDENGHFVPEYLLWALQTEEIKTQYIELQTGTALKQLPVGRLKQVIIKEPSIELQQKFATFVEQVDKSKFAIQQQLLALETLKKSLMQKYFA